VESLGARYPRQPDWLLKNVSFRIGPGESVGILGANGVGKSTLLRVLLDMHTGERSGRVTYRGNEGIPRTAVGFATQQTALYSQLTVVENLRHVARLTVPAGVRDAVDRCLQEYGLGRVAKRRVHDLSAGWQRLVHLACSFAHDPVIRLLDEPTNALDFETRTRLIDLMAAWRERGDVCLLTSHYPEDIDEMCSHALVLYEDQTTRFGRLSDLMASADPELILRQNLSGGPTTSRLRLPRATPDVMDVVRVLEDHGRRTDRGCVTGLSLAASSVRLVLRSDPELGSRPHGG
jgi:ABC-2 type transport system ATP-binding protein